MSEYKVKGSAPYVQGEICYCIGPQKGEPYCPCMMRQKGVFKREGRWVEPEKDLGLVNRFEDILKDGYEGSDNG